VADENNRTEVFHCPCCGQVAPIVRLTEDGPHDFDQGAYTWGGSRPLTDEELEKRFKYGRGSAPGLINYEPWHMPTEELRDALIIRLNELLEVI
jgi:hypothetical protein